MIKFIFLKKRFNFNKSYIMFRRLLKLNRKYFYLKVWLFKYLWKKKNKIKVIYIFVAYFLRRLCEIPILFIFYFFKNKYYSIAIYYLYFYYVIIKNYKLKVLKMRLYDRYTTKLERTLFYFNIFIFIKHILFYIICYYFYWYFSENLLIFFSKISKLFYVSHDFIFYKRTIVIYDHTFNEFNGSSMSIYALILVFIIINSSYWFKHYLKYGNKHLKEINTLIYFTGFFYSFYFELIGMLYTKVIIYHVMWYYFCYIPISFILFYFFGIIIPPAESFVEYMILEEPGLADHNPDVNVPDYILKFPKKLI